MQLGTEIVHSPLAWLKFRSDKNAMKSQKKKEAKWDIQQDEFSLFQKKEISSSKLLAGFLP